MVALDTAGRPIKGQAVAVHGRVSQVITTRKRLVGGFYAYDNRTEVKDLGALCSGTPTTRACSPARPRSTHAGQVELIAEAKDAQGHSGAGRGERLDHQQGELWFSQDNDDRIDVLPEKKRYEPGETARLQVRMPFREATALVAVEREGVIATQVVTLRGDDPTVELKIEPTWGPNVYVSVLALRGRIRETPWYSFFTWGWKEPLAWWRSFRFDGKDYQAPTAMIDLAKPAFKLGVAAIKVGLAAHELQVSVTADKAEYMIREKAIAKVRGDAGRQAAGRCRGRVRGRRRGPARAARQRVVEAARRDDEGARLGRRDEHGAERDHRPAPLRQEGRGGGRRRRARRDARAVRHAARLEAERRP